MKMLKLMWEIPTSGKNESGFSSLALHGGERSVSCPGRFTAGEKRSWYPLDRKLGGPLSQSGRGGEEKISQPLPGLESPMQPVAQRYTTDSS